MQIWSKGKREQPLNEHICTWLATVFGEKSLF